MLVGSSSWLNQNRTDLPQTINTLISFYHLSMNYSPNLSTLSFHEIASSQSHPGSSLATQYLKIVSWTYTQVVDFCKATWKWHLSHWCLLLQRPLARPSLSLYFSSFLLALWLMRLRGFELKSQINLYVLCRSGRGLQVMAFFLGGWPDLVLSYTLLSGDHQKTALALRWVFFHRWGLRIWDCMSNLYGFWAVFDLVGCLFTMEDCATVVQDGVSRFRIRCMGIRGV